MDSVLPLFVAIPLLCAALCVIAPNRFVRAALHVAVPAAGVVAGMWLFAETMQHGVLAHNVGEYVGGISIPFTADPFTGLMVAATSVVAVAANWFATVAREVRARYYCALSLMLLAGVNGALMTGDLFNLFVFIEVMLLPSYGLIAMTGTWSRLAGGRTFVLVNLLASTILLIGVALVYATAGSANMAVLAGAAHGNGPVTVAMGLVVIALCMKAGVFPVHTWLPRTYPGTSASVMGLFSGIHTKVAVYALFRIYVIIFDMDSRWAGLIALVMCISMLIGGFGGLAEYSMRRIIGYQMVNGMPFILVMFAFTQADPAHALAAGMFYMVHHMVTIGSLVLTAGSIEETYGTGSISKLTGLMRRDPMVATVFVMGAFSIVGFPPFSGVFGKLFIVFQIAKAHSVMGWVVIAVIVVASFGALLSMVRLWREVFWGQNMKAPEGLFVPMSKLAPGASLAILSVAMFFGAGVLTEATVDAAGSLVNVPAYQRAVLGDVDTAVGLDGADVQAPLHSEPEPVPAVATELGKAE